MTNIRARQPYARRPAPQDQLKPFLDTELANIQRGVPVPITRTVVVDASVVANDDLILADATAVAITVSLGPADRLQFLKVTIKRVNDAGGIVTVSGDMDGISSFELRAVGQSLTVQSDGAVWQSVQQDLDPGSYVIPQDGRTDTTLTQYLANNAPFNPKDYGAVGDGVTDDYPAFAACFAAAPNGSTITISPSFNMVGVQTTYRLSAFPVIDKQLRIRGSVATVDDAGSHMAPILEYVGSSRFIVMTGTAATGSILQDIGLAHSGTGTVAIDIDTSEAKLLGVSCSSPAVAFSNSAVRVGNGATVTDILLRDTVFRSAAPVGLKAVSITAQIVLDHARFLHHSVQNVLLGTSTTDVIAFHAVNGCSFEQGANVDSVFVQRARLVSFSNCYFESVGTGYAINVPSTATLAEGIQVHRSWFAGFSAATAAINSDFSAGDITADGNYYTGFATSFIRNNNRRRLSVGSNFSNDNVPSVNADTGVTRFANWQAAAAGTNYVSGTTTFGAVGDSVGFYGASPVARQVLATGTGKTVDNVITALQNLGLVSQT